MVVTATRLPRLAPLAFVIASSFGAFTSNIASAVTLRVTDCGDGSSSGTLRNTILSAPDNSIIQILTCSKITVTQGAILIPSELSNIYIVGQGQSETIIEVPSTPTDRYQSRVFLAQNPGTIGLSQVTVQGGKFTGNSGPYGGCIFADGSVGLNKAVVTGCTVSPASAPARTRGGAIYAGGSVSLVDSEVTNSYAIGAPGQRAEGGGIFALAGVFATRSTISGNHAIAGAGAGLSHAGGFSSGTIGNVVLTRSTVSNNTADVNAGFEAPSFRAGYTVNIASSTVANNVASVYGTIGTFIPTTVTNSTIAFNRATQAFTNEPTGLYSSQTITMNNSIFANNIATDEPSFDVYSAGSGGLTGSHNLITSTANTVPPGTVDACPLLGHLSDNGGSTQTIPLLVHSPAIDTGAANGQTTDQRGTGFPRTVGAAADIGAYERQTGVVDDVIFFSEFDSRCN